MPDSIEGFSNVYVCNSYFSFFHEIFVNELNCIPKLVLRREFGTEPKLLDPKVEVRVYPVPF